ncbi:thioesterase family protein [Oharaeibacter diazotrophicus]|uniref:Acyl-CoA thioester hydrolase n=1 Tax=Oharaeibacter diazotrophicus TaxID=1920512 RepID=A0A4R6RHC5_9HYPH|nr:thioesterase family protein [Oharaeibacter diazotrophicus]TDP85565.1 acyl-CoA thioester hydrolase [Oharaeibacter diazotrophicus]BBE74536.1 L-carnitine dehydrogenase [Pleomorphomonas sp. SM30]
MSHAVPFTTPPTGLEPGWIDYNGHLNMAYYNVLFDRAVDLALDAAGLGESWRTAGGGTFFTVEVHLRYLAEVPPDGIVRTSVRLVGHDAKRVHLFLEMRDAVSGLLHATSEQLLLHVDPATRRVARFPDEAAVSLAAWELAESGLAPVEDIGRRIALSSARPASA